MARRRRKEPNNLGALAWILFLLIVVVVYMINHNRIQQVLRSTGFIEVVFEDRNKPESESTPVPAPTTTAPPAAVPPAEVPSDGRSSSTDTPPPTGTTTATETNEGTSTTGTPQTAPEPPTTTVIIPPPTEAPADAPANQLRASLYYVRLGDDGVIYPAAVERRVRYTTSPLTETIRALLTGPTVEDLNQGVITLIPERTELLSANVQGSIAFLNFNEAFRFNDFGAEGTWAQLQQVVLTATHFQTVRAVQIMIEGNVVSFLSGDGIFVGEPLTRASF